MIDPASPIQCGGCGQVIADRFDQPNLASLMTDHDLECATHSFTEKCGHEGRCYRAVG